MKKMDYKQYALLLKAFAHEKRIRVLHLLYYRGEAAEKDLNRISGFNTRRQLDYLGKHGLVVSSQKEATLFFMIKDDYKGLAEAILSRLTDDQTLQEDLKQYDTLLHTGELQNLPHKTVSHQI